MVQKNDATTQSNLLWQDKPKRGLGTYKRSHYQSCDFGDCTFLQSAWKQTDSYGAIAPYTINEDLRDTCNIFW